MAGLGARTTRGRLGKVHLQHITGFAVGHRIADLVFLFGGMHFMAGSAGAAAFVFVHMNEMQVLIAVAELGQRGGFRILHHRRLMAIEAQVV